MSSKNAMQWGLLMLAVALISAQAVAQDDDPFADVDSDDEAAPEAPEAAAEDPSADPEPEAPAEPEPAPEEPAPAAEAEATTGAGAETNVSLSAATTAIDTDTTEAPAPVPDTAPPVVTGSHIRRPRLMVDGALIIDSPLRTEVQGREYLQMRRQLSGAAMPDTAAALGFGATGTSRIELRLQPTLILLNGRRLPTAPFAGPSGSDFVDINMIPIQLIDRTEITSGHAAGLYGEGAMGGVANFITRRDIDGIDVELGGQATDKLDQGEADIAVTLGTGEGRSGANLMLSYFNRQPLAASDREWIDERLDRTESLLSFPSAFQQINRNIDYPISDPFCDIATQAGHAEGYEVRLRGYGAVGNLDQLSADQRMRFITVYDGSRGLMADRGDGDIDPLQAPTYCAVDYTKNNDLILKDERIQLYSTFWHGLSDHTEIYGEAGYYRSDNENRTAPAFPMIRTNLSVERDIPLIVPFEHADTPVQEYGFSGRGAGVGAANAELFIIGRTQGNFNGDGVHERRIDSFRGVLGIKGDLKAAAPNTIFSTWDWDVGGAFGTTELLSRVNDTLMSRLHEALEACAGESVNPLDPTMSDPISIKDRQEAGCFNPYYNSVTNNAALDPLNVSNLSAQISRKGFVTSDTDGNGLQDGGYICDPADPLNPERPCPPGFDRNGDMVYELAGTPNTQQVIDRITGEHIEYQRRSLATVDAEMRGDLVKLGSDGALSFQAGAQYRRESLLIDYDQAYNERDYGFLFGADDLEPVNRDVVAGNVELRLRVANGLLEVQPAARIEAYDTVGMGMNGLLGLAVRPFANSGSEPLEYLGIRGHVGYGMQPPTLTQMYGMQNEFVQVDYRAATQYLPHQVSGNTELDFEKYTTLSGGPMWDWAGIHIGAEFWMTFIRDVITTDNPRTLVNDCTAQFEDPENPSQCSELRYFNMTDSFSHIETKYDNMADVDTNGIDGTVSYTLDSKRRGLGDFGTFVLGVQGTYVNSYLIKGPRVLASYYRDGAPEVANNESFAPGVYVAPDYNADGTRNYDNINAEYEAAGYRNYENFAPPIPKLRFSVPLRWMYEGHTVGATMRFIDGYFDDSEYTVEKRNLQGVNRLQFFDGEEISASVMFDLMYGFAFGSEETWKGAVTVGVLNVADSAPPAVESSLGYEVGLHDPRGRTLYARVSGDF